MRHVLGEFNLTDNEIKIYLRLLELGSAPAGELTQKTGIHRRNVYDSIERLVKKGLVGYITVDKKKHFRASDPKRFFHLIEQEKQKTEQKEEALQKVMPQLMMLNAAPKHNQRVTVFEGKKGHINILEDVLKTGKTNHVFRMTEPTIIKDYISMFHKKRIKKKITDKIILNPRESKRAKMLAKERYTDIRLMPEGFESPIVLNIYGGKVGMLIHSENPLGLLIEDKDVYDAFMEYFKVMWNTARPV